MKDMFKQIPLTVIKALSPKQKVQKLMTEIGGGWYLEKVTKGLPPLRRPKLSKRAQAKEDEIKNYIRRTGIGMIGHSNYIGTSLNGLIQEVK